MAPRHITQTPSTIKRQNHHTLEKIIKNQPLITTAMVFQSLRMPFFQKGTTHIVAIDYDQYDRLLFISLL